MSRTKSFVAAVVALVVIAALVVLNAQDRESSNGSVDESALTRGKSTRLASVSTEPVLVGRETCKECHAENYHLHAGSGHASTLTSTKDLEIANRFTGKEHNAGEPYGTFTYFSDSNGLHARREGESKAFPLEYALGSGEHGITLFSLVPDTEQGGTMGIEHRVSWFGTDHELGITPGHNTSSPKSDIEFFGDIHRGETLDNCIGCHSTAGKIVDQQIVGLVANVNCEKCHGPGSEHVRQARDSKSPPPYSVGRDDWDTESEIQLCGSCHRLPQDMSRKQLRDYADTLVRFQPIGLLRSKCYLESEGELKCTTCHDPHLAIKKKSHADYEQDCIDCHRENSEAHVACPVSTTEGCIGCHMPAPRLDHEVAFHDHWIRVLADD